jgi:hypothetical protein
MEKKTKMKFLNSYWFLILAATVAIIGLVTGWYFFILLILPFGLFKSGKKDRDD